MGQFVDYAALSVLARSFAISPTTGMPMRTSLGHPVYAWRIRGIFRFPLRTSYETVAEMIADVASIPGLHKPRCVLDSTGVGVSTTETVRAAMKRCPDVQVWGCSITAGEGWRVSGRNQVNAAKSQLTGALRSALEGGRLRACRRADDTLPKGADLLVNELRQFKVKTTKAGTDVYSAASSHHDDIVLSLCLPIWLATLPFMSLPEGDYAGMSVVAAQAQREALQAEVEQREEQRSERLLTEAQKRKRENLASWQVRVDEEAARDFFNDLHWGV